MWHKVGRFFTELVFTIFTPAGHIGIIHTLLENLIDDANSYSSMQVAIFYIGNYVHPPPLGNHIFPP